MIVIGLEISCFLVVFVRKVESVFEGLIFEEFNEFRVGVCKICCVWSVVLEMLSCSLGEFFMVGL